MDPEIKLSKIKRINYESMLDTANEFKIRSKKSEEKMNKILIKSKQSKSNSKMIEHKKIWNLESIRLNKKKRKLQREIDSLTNNKTPNLNNDNLFIDISELSDQILEDHVNFKSDVIDHVWTLCEDLKEWKVKKSHGYKVADREPILEVINSTKYKLDQIALDLEREEKSIFNSLQSDITQYCSSLQYESIHSKVGTGIPSETWDIECLDKEVLVELLSQFIHVDSYFQTKLDSRIKECEFVNERSAPTDCPNYLMQLFEHLHDTYFTHSTVNRNQLWQDINRVVFPNTVSTTLSEMEHFIHCKKMFKEKTQALVADWKHDRSELLNKIKASIIEYNEEMVVTQIEAEKFRNQKEICRQLNDKVNNWRKQKEELHSLQEALEKEREDKCRIEAEQLQERELMQRNKTKQKIFQYKIDKNYRQEIQMIEKQRRIDELKEYLEKQATIDNERVEYREQLRLQKVAEQLEKKQISMEQQRLTDLKLNKLIEQVRPNIESDPNRLFKPTTAWLHHTDDDKSQSETNESVQNGAERGNRYAMPLYTYNNKDVLSDPRFRVEHALREAGLLNSEYARTLLKSIPTNQVPRKDCNLSDINFLKYD